MISILEHIHNKFIPRTDDDDPVVIKRKVFGGDVLTNERAYSAQLAMLNHAWTKFPACLSILTLWTCYVF
jgi:hypothetical protein